MSIKLKDYIKGTSDILTKDDAKLVYYKANRLDEIEVLFKWYSLTTSIINQYNYTNYNWKDELFVDCILNKIRGNKNNKFEALTELTTLELVMLLSEASVDGEF